MLTFPVRLRQLWRKQGRIQIHICFSHGTVTLPDPEHKNIAGDGFSDCESYSTKDVEEEEEKNEEALLFCTDL